MRQAAFFFQNIGKKQKSILCGIVCRALTSEVGVQLITSHVGAPGVTAIGGQSMTCLILIQSLLPSLKSWHSSYYSFGPQFYRQKGYSTLAETLTVTAGIESRLQHICDRHATIVRQLGAHDASSMSPQEMAKLNKEASDLNDVVCMVEDWRRAKQEVSELEVPPVFLSSSHDLIFKMQLPHLFSSSFLQYII